MGLLHFVAVGTLGHRGREQVVVGATLVLACLGMSTFWIRHYITPGSRLARGNTHCATPNKVGFYGLSARKSIVS
jgi:hypothetical protein